MLPVNQFILSGSDPLFNSGNLNEQIQYLEEQKRIIDARQKQIQQVVNGQQVLPTQQQPQVSVWDLIDSEIEPLTTEQRNMLANNEEYVNNYNSLQAMVRTEVLNLVRAKIEGSPMVTNTSINRKLSKLLMRCTMSKTVRNISVKNTICKKPTKFVINSKIN